MADDKCLESAELHFNIKIYSDYFIQYDTKFAIHAIQ